MQVIRRQKALPNKLGANISVQFRFPFGQEGGKMQLNYFVFGPIYLMDKRC